MNDRELLELAAKPEEDHKSWCDYLNIMLMSMPPQKAKCNCKIAKPEQDHGFDRTASHMAGEYVDTKQVNTSEERVQKSDKSIHEPVAWIYNGNLHWTDPTEWATDEVIPLYTAPPSKEWIGLTDEEVKNILDCGRGEFIAIKKTEAKLKEKNNAI